MWFEMSEKRFLTISILSKRPNYRNNENYLILSHTKFAKMHQQNIMKNSAISARISTIKIVNGSKFQNFPKRPKMVKWTNNIFSDKQ